MTLTQPSCGRSILPHRFGSVINYDSLSRGSQQVTCLCLLSYSLVDTHKAEVVEYSGNHKSSKIVCMWQFYAFRCRIRCVYETGSWTWGKWSKSCRKFNVVEMSSLLRVACSRAEACDCNPRTRPCSAPSPLLSDASFSWARRGGCLAANSSSFFYTHGTLYFLAQKI